MRQWAKRQWQRWRQLALYGIVGIFTTLINVVVFDVLQRHLGVHYALANVVAWVAAVVFAFFPNKIFVFDNGGWAPRVVLREAVNFFLSRAASLVADEALMALAVSVLHLPELPSKAVVNIVVILINFELGKLWVFNTARPAAPKAQQAAVQAAMETAQSEEAAAQAATEAAQNEEAPAAQAAIETAQSVEAAALDATEAAQDK